MLRTLFFISTMLFAFDIHAQDLEWAKQVSSNNPAGVISMVTDRDGNSYSIISFTDTIDADPGSGTYYLVADNNWVNTCILKLDASGNFVWAKQLKGSVAGPGSVLGKDISTDDHNFAYSITITGSYNQTVDFDPDTSTYNLTSNGAEDIFVLSLYVDDGEFRWARSIGGTGNDAGTAVSILIDTIYVTGNYSNTVVFDPSDTQFTRTSSGGYDIFLLKLGPPDGKTVWAFSKGSSGNDAAIDISPGLLLKNLWLTKINNIDSLFLVNVNYGIEIGKTMKGTSISSTNDTDIYITGTFANTYDFDPDPGTYNLTASGSSDAFICRLDSGLHFIWAKQIGGNGICTGNNITTDHAGSAYVTGMFTGTIDADPSVVTQTLTEAGSQNNGDIFYVKLNANGDLYYAHSIGNTNIDIGTSIDIDDDGYIYMAGTFSDMCDFDPGTGVYDMTSTDIGADGYIMKLSSTLNVKETNKKETEIQLYPNPATNSFYISSPALIKGVQVTDMLGRVVYSVAPDNYVDKIDLDIVPGIYNVSINTSNERVVKKVVLK